MSTTQDTYDRLHSEAHRMGSELGSDHAQWYFDGNTPDSMYAWVLRGLEDGDPEIYDTFRSSPLSGEWADEITLADLAEDLGVSQDDDAFDDYCRAFEDGYGVAYADEVEKIARRHMTTERTLATEMCGRFTRRKRSDGTEYVCLTDAAPEWMRDVCREAHGDMLPDDWRYDRIWAACEFIANETDWDDRVDEFADVNVDYSTGALVEWYASHGLRAEYVQEARDEWQDPDASVDEWFQRGQYLEAREILELVSRALAERLP